MSDPITAAAIMAVTTAAATGTQMAMTYNMNKEAEHKQKEAQALAEEKQRKADEEAEMTRLQGIAADQEATNYGNIWATDAAKYKDAAQKFGAGTGSFDTDDDETNPFYSRGLF